MSTINDQIGIQPHDVKWAIDQMRLKNLTVDNSFQRNYVWLQKHQIKLLETILMGFPIPEIYLWQQATDAKTGDTIYSIIDGQQRLGAILNFINDEYVLKSEVLDNQNQKSRYSGKCFSELDDDLRSLIWKFKLSIRLVRESVQRTDIVKMFLRLNSTNMTLNPQELRNAEFDGLFVKLAAELSENDFWKDHSIFSRQDVRRMTDIQFISSILVFFRLGIGEDTNQENFNRVFDMFNEDYAERNADKLLFESILFEINRVLDKDKVSEKFIKRKTHLYTLFLVTYYFIRTKGQLSRKSIRQYRKFTEAYNDNHKLEESFTQEQIKSVAEYKRLSSTGTQSKVNRMRRYEILKELME